MELAIAAFSNGNIAAVAKLPTRIGSCDGEQCLADGFLKCFACASTHSTQKRFELREGFFNRRQAPDFLVSSCPSEL